MKKKSILFFALLIFSTVVMLSSCKKEQTNTTTETETAPTVPPSSSFEMSFSDFPASAGKMANVDSVVNPYSNAQYAIINVAWWNLIVGLYTVVPTAAFVEALKHQATYVSKGSWEWTYDFTVLVKYTANLHATLVNNKDSVKWGMYISQQNGFKNLLWFSGVSAFNGKSGNWTLNKDSIISSTEHMPIPCIYMEWNNNNNGITDLKYTDILANDNGYGSYVKAGVLSNTAYFDSYYNIYLVNKNSTNHFTEIHWNKVDKSGQIKDTTYFKDNNWYCWDIKANSLKNLSNCR